MSEQEEKLKLAILRFAHAIRNPLAAAKMGAQLISRKPSDPEYCDGQAKRIALTLDKADVFIQELVELAQTTEDT